MNTPLTLEKVSKKQLTAPLIGLSEQEAKTIMRYRKKLSVIENAELTESSVDARTLHVQLGNGARFNDWIKRRIKSFGLVEGKDYYSFLSTSESCRATVDYSLTIDTAKHLAMTEKTGAGFLIRDYFLLCEKVLKQMYMYNPFRILSKKNVLRLSDVYEREYRKTQRPERFFPRIHSLIAVSATGATPSQWRELGYPNLQDFMEAEDEQVYTHVQDTVIRMLESGQDFASIKELCDMLYPDEQRNIYSKYKLAAANDCCLMNAA